MTQTDIRKDNLYDKKWAGIRWQTSAEKKGYVFRMIFARGMNESPLDSDCDTSSSEGEYNVIICLLYLFTLSLHYLNSFLTFDVLSFSVTST